MKLQHKKNSILREKASAYIITVFDKEPLLHKSFKEIDKKINNKITKLLKNKTMKTSLGSINEFPVSGELNADYLFVVSLGEKKQFNIDVLRTQTANIFRKIDSMKLNDVAFSLEEIMSITNKKNEAYQAVAEGIFLSQYSFKRHKTKISNKETAINKISIHSSGEKNSNLIQKMLNRGEVFATSANLTKDLANEPANYMTPSNLAETALEIAEAHGLDCQIINKSAAKEMGMGSYLSVAAGSNQEPKFIILKYTHKSAKNKPVALIGKGITFDTGGISLKPSAGMEEMKGDMSGAATVLGVMNAIGQLKPKINVVGIAPCTENMPGGKATKPGDVVYAMDGQSIEVLNTDAEGRLVLADAISYAVKEKCSAIVDIATLTGAMMISLGSVRTGVFSNDDTLFEKLDKASKKSNEPIWRMPLDDAYGKMIISNVADIKNVGDREAGSITAAKFLEKFVGKTPWAHMDIAGVMTIKQSKGEWTKGMSGNPVRTLIHMICDY
tara:strand:- start:638 stop:2134 length:1497 start_codon:yes stop_codon:yes gene_type:complete